MPVLYLYVYIRSHIYVHTVGIEEREMEVVNLTI